MTAFDRIDALDARFSSGIEELAAASRPDYLDDVFQVTAQSRQRRWWTYPGRWLPMTTTMPVQVGRVRVPVYVLVALLLLALVATLLVAIAGSRPRPAPPYGPAQNGSIAYGGEDLYVRDGLNGTPRLLISGPGRQQGGWYSPDGTLIAYDNVVDGVTTLTVANADGSNSRPLYVAGEDGGWIAWSGDSRHMSLVAGLPTPHLTILSTDGTPARTVPLGDLVPNGTAIWDPKVPGQLLFRGVQGGNVGLWYVRDDGTDLRPLPLPLFPAVLDDQDFEFSAITFSDDGEHIALNVAKRGDTEESFQYRIGLMDRDGSHARLLPYADATQHEAWPQFSPDGQWLAVQHFQYGGTVTMAIRRADGSDEPRDVLTPFVDDSNTMDAIWAPDSSRLIAWERAPGLLYEVDPVTGTATLLPDIDDMPGWQRRPAATQ